MSELPTWDEMSDLDKGAALLHTWKVEQEGFEYATTDYPCEYFDDPRLVALSKTDASAHARRVADYDSTGERIGWDEVERLYDAAEAADRGRMLARRNRNDDAAE